MLRVVVTGQPVPFKRTEDGGRKGHRVTVERERMYREFVAACAFGAMRQAGLRGPIAGPVELRLEVYLRDLRMGDCSNYTKVVEDTFNGLVWHDDVQVARLGPVVRHLDRERPRVVITVTPLAEPPDDELPEKARRDYVPRPKGAPRKRRRKR